MRPVLRWTAPVLMAALALANTACGSKSSEHTPTGPRPPVPFGDNGRVSSMSEPYLGTAANFAILAGTPNITCNVGGTVTGDLGIAPAAAILGFGGAPCTNVGTSHAADAVALTAKNDLTTAFGTLAGLGCSSTVGPDLVGLTLVPGVYCVNAAATNLSGLLQLNALGNPNAVWVFQMSSSLITSPNSTVSVINGGSGCGVQWLVNSSATIDVNTTFVGNIVALTSIVLNGGATLNPGRALARNGAVTLNNNIVSQAACLAATVPPPFPGGAGGPGGVAALPHGMEWALLVILVGTGTYILRRH
jgi:Ice-binding-like